MCDRNESLKSVIKSAECLRVVEDLEFCMTKNDRKWIHCQTEVKALKLCKAAEEAVSKLKDDQIQQTKVSSELLYT